MEVKRYIYQSPYNAPVQFGRPDPVSRQSESMSYDLSQKSDETLKKAHVLKSELQNTATEGSTDTTNRARQRVLDIYV